MKVKPPALPAEPHGDRFPRKTLQDLEWGRLLEHLAERATSEESAARCRGLPFLEATAARLHLAQVRELMGCFEQGDAPPELPASPVGAALAHIRSDGAVPAEALLAISANLKLFTALARFLENRRDSCPLNAEAVIPRNDPPASPIALARLAAEIESSFEPDGTLADQASAALGKLRRSVVSLREHLLASIEQIAEREEDLLQERTVTLRNDRFVLPVRADAHRRFPGIVHGSSQTGATIFVEPAEMVEIGNRLMLAREAVQREEARILAELRGAVREQLGEVRYACRAIVDTEVRIAAARLGRDLDCSVPQAAAAGVVDLRLARHPLLQLEGIEVVPVDVSAQPGQTLLVSGPNAGGKTVVLKTTGLLGLMLAAGLPVPAAPESCFGLPGCVLTDIGDDQSLELSLSTFSAHMTNIAAIIDVAENGAVVLLDELAAGTDPLEGTALAQAILDALNNAGATSLATTHFDALKTRAQDDDRYVNAAMGFDADAGQPTFELRLGVPGSSSGLEVARRYGIPETVLARARSLLPEGVRELASAVEALQREQRDTRLERGALAEQRKLLEASQSRLDDELRRLRARQDKLLDDESSALWTAIRRAREKVRDAETRIRRRRVDQSTVRRVRGQINEIAAQLDPGGELDRQGQEELPGEPATADALAPGTRVWIGSLRSAGQIEGEVRGGKVTVLAGAIRTRVSLRDLRIVDAPGRDGRQHPRAAAAAASQPSEDVIRTSDNTLDLRGMTVDEALDATDAYLDQALGGGVDAVFILHGHGTGALRDAVRRYLEGSPYVERFRPGKRSEGGDGITAVWIK